VIAHTLLIERIGLRVRGVIFQGCELGTQPTPPVFSRPKQAFTDPLIPVLAANGDLSNMAVDYVPVHGIGRLIKPGVYEPNNLAAEFRDKGNRLPVRVRRMLPTPSIARGYRFMCGCEIAFRVKL
jgi:hypothetical protein